MPKISACIISFNEEQRIEECLASVRAVADEIVVVDSNSTDRTREIALKYADSVIEQPFLGHVEQKNFAAQQASNDWILSLDCDETLSAPLAESILAVKDTLDTRKAYQFNRRTFYLYRWIDHVWYPDTRIRLFDRRACRWGGVNPHDHVEAPAGSVGNLRGDLLHHTYESLSDHLDTINKFSDIAAAEMVKKGRRVTVVTILSHSGWAFIRAFFLKRGFLDGFAGLIISLSTGLSVFTKYTKVYLALHYNGGEHLDR